MKFEAITAKINLTFKIFKKISCFPCDNELFLLEIIQHQPSKNGYFSISTIKIFVPILLNELIELY